MLGSYKCILHIPTWTLLGMLGSQDWSQNALRFEALTVSSNRRKVLPRSSPISNADGQGFMYPICKSLSLKVRRTNAFL